MVCFLDCLAFLRDRRGNEGFFMLEFGFGDNSWPFVRHDREKVTVIVGKLVELSAKDSERCYKL